MEDKYTKAESWIQLNWPNCSYTLPNGAIVNLAGCFIDRKSSLCDFKELLIQNLDKSKNFEEDKKKINNFFDSLEKINFT